MTKKTKPILRKYSTDWWRSPEGIKEIEAYVTLGLSNADIIKIMGVSSSTFYNMLKKDKKLATTVNRAQKANCDEVVNSLYKRALGYDSEEFTDEFRVVDGEKILYRQKKNTKHNPADVTAAMFWLKNRAPEDWRDKQREDDEGDSADKLAEALLKLVESRGAGATED